MHTVLLRLVGPMQSWGTTSRFDQRDSGKEPSKSGVVGLLAAALGIDRENWPDLEPITRLHMGVRHDRPGVPKRDYQTAGCAATDTIIKADGTQAKWGGVVSQRCYIADAAFLVGLASEDRMVLERIHAALLDPVWPLALGRKSYLPSEPIWLKDALLDAPLLEALRQWPCIASRRNWEAPPEMLRISYDSDDEAGVLRMDQPLSSFAKRRFGARFVRSDWILFPQEVSRVPA
jgi:CRISPR system Cascade subunit CasD